MKVKEAMHKGVDWVGPDTPVVELAKLMCEHDIGAIPIGENDHLIGMVTDRDIVVRAVAENRPPGNAAVSTVMSEGVYCCYDDDGVTDAARLMAEHQVRRLPVLNRGERMVGIVALADIARCGVKEAETLALENISQPSPQPRH